MPRSTVLMLVLFATATFGWARVADAADPTLEECRRDCKLARRACLAEVKSQLRGLLGGCTGRPPARRQCKRAAKTTARAARAACERSKRDCRACCSRGARDCAAFPTTSTTSTSTTTTTTLSGGASTTSTTMPTGAPSSPRIVFLTATGTDEITLAWLPVTDDATPASAIRYEVHVAEQAGFDPTAATLRVSVEGSQPGDEPRAVVGGLAAGARYHVLVVALDAAGRASAGRDYRSLTLPTLPVVRSATTPLETAAGLGLGEPAVSGSTYTYPAGPGTTPPSVGAVLFGTGQQEAYLRRVDSVTSAGGQIVVETSAASLSDAVEQMALASSHTLFAVGGEAGSAAVAARGAGAATDRDADVRRWGGGLLVAAGSGPSKAVVPRGGSTDVGVDADVDFDPELRTGATWTTDLIDGVTLTNAEVVARGTFSMSLDAHFRFTAAGSVQRTIPLPALTRTYTSVYAVGSVPVHQQITFTLTAEVSATAAAAIDATARAGATAAVEFGVRYNPATEGWDEVSSAVFQPTLTADLVVKGKVAGQVRLVPRIEVRFYGAVSAHVSIEPSLRAEIETQATTNPVCSPLELTRFDAGLVVEPFVSADFRALARNVTILGRTRVGGPFTFVLFDLPRVQVSNQDRGNGMVSVLASVTDGTNHPFDPASARWDVSPETASVTPETGSTLGVLTCQQMATYRVTFSGHGVLGEEGRRCTAVDVPCTPPTTTTTVPGSTTTSTLPAGASTTTTTSTSSSTTSSTDPTAPCGTFLRAWGTQGNGPGQFIGPRGVAVDRRNRNVYVTDGGTNRVQKFDQNGGFLGTWGTTGSGDGGFSGILGVAIGPDGDVFVVDSGANRIQKFEENGGFLAKWGTAGTGDGQFDTPWGIATDASGNVYVVERNNVRVQKFDANGGFLAKWGTPGHLDGELSTPLGVATDAIGNVFVVEQSGRRVQKFTAAGGFLAKWGAPGDPTFQAPIALATDALGNVFVADPFRGDIQRFTGTGTLLAKWGSTGNGNGQFQWPIGIASDGNGNVYVADRDQRRIQKFACP